MSAARVDLPRVGAVVWFWWGRRGQWKPGRVQSVGRRWITFDTAVGKIRTPRVNLRWTEQEATNAAK